MYTIVEKKTLTCNLLVCKLLLTTQVQLPVMVMKEPLLIVQLKTISLIIAVIQKM